MSENLPALEDYRHGVRTWLEANLDRREEATGRFGFSNEITEERLAEQRAIQRKIFDAGYAGISWPTAYGGQGLPESYERAFDDEAASFATPDFGIAGGTTFGVCARTMLAHASPEFLERHVPKILAGERLFVQFFSDPEAGSDLAGVRTRADRAGDNWILNGSKIWSSGAYYADYGMCLARTDWDVPKHRGLTWFAVPIDSDGVTVRRIKQITGDAEFCQEFFDDVELRGDDVIGSVNDGWSVAQTMLFFERGGSATAAVEDDAADVRRLPADLIELADRSGKLGDSRVQDLIVRAHVDAFAKHQLDLRVGALMKSDPLRASAYASYSKLASGVLDPLRANMALDIAEGAATTWSDPETAPQVALDLLNSRFMSIAGGTNEVQRNSIGERVLGLPREPSFDTQRSFREVIRASLEWSGKVG
ncbi:acyl-CoA dehydrogenase family protein [Rhodococcoides yunnanense]|uniref:acyl-CoA dehydrogenase family protein n=1 Tax=Rhodococcoides yunnanense TaxID=278209 RepID=UPI000934F123|nr:acyl-CoA dehydrogenase family protein [Rhodococcus yunnanensis]